MDRAQAAALDADDPLAPFRDRFELPDGVVYLDGNSLGPLPKGVAERLRTVVDEQWRDDLIRSWNVHGWVDLPLQVGEKIGRMIGADSGTTVACDSTSVNLYKVAAAALDLADRRVVLTDTGNFPTDVYVLSGLADTTLCEPDDIAERILEHAGGVLSLTEVDYRTGRKHDMGAITELAHRHGMLVIWDLAHSVGAFPVDVAGCDVDFAVGCGYKYLNGGPGAPAFLYVAPRHLTSTRNPINGWFGHRAPFDFSLEFSPAEGIDRMRVGTSHILSLAALDAALDVFADVDLEAAAVKGRALTSALIDGVSALDDEYGFTLASPLDPARRGSHVSFHHEHGYSVMSAMIERGVIGDFRAPDIVRLGVAPLYLRHVDIVDAVETIEEIMREGSWREPHHAQRQKVT